MIYEEIEITENIKVPEKILKIIKKYGFFEKDCFNYFQNIYGDKAYTFINRNKKSQLLYFTVYQSGFYDIMFKYRYWYGEYLYLPALDENILKILKEYDIDSESYENLYVDYHLKYYIFKKDNKSVFLNINTSNNTYELDIKAVKYRGKYG